MEKLSKDIVDSAISGKMKQSVLRHYRDFGYHSYVYECYLKLPVFMYYDKPKLKVLNEILTKTLTLDMVFSLYVDGMACMNHLLPSIHYQLFTYNVPPTGLEKCFMNLHDTMLLRFHIQNYMEKLGHGPLQASVTISRYGDGWYDPFREKYTTFPLIRKSKDIRECYERAIKTICLVNNPECTRTRYRHMYKIHRVKVYNTEKHKIYPLEFWNMYIECCKHWNVTSHLQLIKI